MPQRPPRSGPAPRSRDGATPLLSPQRLRTVAAFAETMAPGDTGLPGAESQVPVAEKLAAFAAEVPERQLRLTAAGIAAFEWLPFPRRFSQMDLEARERWLDRLADSRWTAHRELLMLMKTLFATNYCRDERVRAAVGHEYRCGVEGVEPPAPPPLGDLEPAGEGESCDIAVVGSGAGGAAAAAILAEAGHEVVVIEAGVHADRSSYPADPVDGTTSLYRDAGLTIAEGLPPIPVPAGRVVGGTTVVNSGTCFRAPDHVLAEWRDRHGIGWASELDAEFEQVERMLHVQAPPLEKIGRNGNLVAAGASALGYRGAPLARNAGDCVQCSSCPLGCRLDAKRGMHLTYLPRAVAAGARIRSGLEARRIVTGLGRARAVECARSGGDPFRVEVRKAVIVAGGSFGTPELLMRSGLGGSAVGRHLRIHPAIWVGARFDEPVRGWEGIMQSYGVEAWQEMGLMMEATFTPLAFAGQWLPGVGREHQERLAAFDRLGANGVQVRDVISRGRVALRRDGSLRIAYRLRRAEARKLIFGMARAAEIWFQVGAREVYPQISGNPVLGLGESSRLESAPPRTRDLRLEAFHPMGTARIGDDPALTVARPDGSVRGIDRLYVADASAFPTALGVNPMITVIAVASKIAGGLADRLT